MTLVFKCISLLLFSLPDSCRVPPTAQSFSACEARVRWPPYYISIYPLISFYTIATKSMVLLSDLVLFIFFCKHFTSMKPQFILEHSFLPLKSKHHFHCFLTFQKLNFWKKSRNYYLYLL